MNKKDFPNPKLNLPKELRDSMDAGEKKTFQGIENSLNLLSAYIYTNINLDLEESDPDRAHAWILRTVSALVLRSLYLRNTFVDAFNSRNMVGIFLPLKALFETVGALAWVLDLLEKNLPPEEMIEKLKPFALGNRGKGALRVGSVDAVNVLTMIEKADDYIKKMAKESSNSSDDPEEHNFFTDFYDLASNPSHPSFEAYEMFGSLADGGMWKAKEPDEIRRMITEDLPGYGALLMSSHFIQNICKKIFEKEKNHFAKVESQPYFS